MFRWIFIFFLTSVLWIGCDPTEFSVEIPEKNFRGLWMVTSVDGPVKNDAALPAMKKFNTGRWIQFNRDSTYTANIKGQFDYGHFAPLLDGKDSVELKSFRGDTYHMAAQYNGKGIGKILHRINVPTMTDTYDYIFNCSVREYDYDSPEYDPYSLVNNRWRLPAETSENDSLLVVRMVNHIDFWIAFLNTANRLELKSFNYANMNTCFEFSNFGIIMNRFNNWESTFKTLFYNRAEAERAYELTTQAIYRSKYEKNDNAYLQGINLFKKIKYQLLHPSE